MCGVVVKVAYPVIVPEHSWKILTVKVFEVTTPPPTDELVDVHLT
jgi:hypothetical protein